jgi:AraC family transcriptional regulator
VAQAASSAGFIVDIAITIKRGHGQKLYSEPVSVTGKALWYIESHLSGDLSLDAISGALGLSRFHLCRAFSVSTGYSPAAYARARRLTDAARELARGAPDILAIALSAGYGSHEAFTRAFRQLFGLTPEQLRAQAHLHNLNLLEPMRMDQPTLTSLASPRVVEHGALLIFGLGQLYSCASNAAIPSQWDRFVPHLGHIPGQIGRAAYGVICNTDDAGNYEYICGVEVSEFPVHPAEFTRLRIGPQTYAVFQHREHISAIGTTWKEIWNHGLTDFGYQAADSPALEHYGEQFDGRTGLGGVQLWVPVKNSAG